MYDNLKALQNGINYLPEKVKDAPTKGGRSQDRQSALDKRTEPIIEVEPP